MTPWTGKVTPEEAERYALRFRASWELDDVMTASAVPVPEPIEDVSAQRISENVYVAQPHAPAPRVDVHEPENSVIIDRTITAADIDAGRAQAPSPRPPAAAPSFNKTMPLQVVPTPPPAPVEATPEVPPSSQRRAHSRPPAPAFPTLKLEGSPASQGPPPSLRAQLAATTKIERPAPAVAPVDDLGFPKKSKTGLLIAVAGGCAAVAAIIAIIAVTSNGGNATASASVVPATTQTAATAAKAAHTEKTSAPATTTAAATTTVAQAPTATQTATAPPPPPNRYTDRRPAAPAGAGAYRGHCRATPAHGRSAASAHVRLAASPAGASTAAGRAEDGDRRKNPASEASSGLLPGMTA